MFIGLSVELLHQIGPHLDIGSSGVGRLPANEHRRNKKSCYEEDTKKQKSKQNWKHTLEAERLRYEMVNGCIIHKMKTK